MEPQTQFEKILEFNKTFEVETYTTPQRDIFTDKKKLLEYRLSLIREEVQELEDSVKNSDFIEVIDALTDILYVTLGAFTAIGVNADKCFDIVHSSNMSKICLTEQEAKDTIEFYLKDPEHRYDTPEYKKQGDKFIVFNRSTMKILKSINYKPASFTSLCEAERL